MFHINKTHAVRRAKLLRDTLSRMDIEISLTKAKELIAKMYEFREWSLFENDQGVASLFDQDVAGSETQRRHTHHIEVLTPITKRPEVAQLVLSVVKPTARVSEEAGPNILASSSLIVETILTIYVAYRQGAFAEASYGTANLLSMNFTGFAPMIISILEEFADVSPRPLHHIAILLATNSQVKNLDRAKTLLNKQLEKFPDDTERHWVLLFLADIEMGKYGGHPSQAAARTHLVEASGLGSPAADFELGLIFEQDREFTDAEKAYRRSIDGGHREAMTNLAILIARGHVTGSPEEMMELMGKAALFGDKIATNFLLEVNGLIDRRSPKGKATEASSRLPTGYDLSTITPPNGWLKRDKAEYIQEIADGNIDHPQRWKRSKTTFTFNDQLVHLCVAKSGNQAERSYNFGTLNEICVTAKIGDHLLGVIGGSVVKRRRSMDAADFFDLCDSASEIDARLAGLILEKFPTPSTLFRTGDALLMLYTWIVERNEVKPGFGASMLHALESPLKKAFGNFGTLAVLVDPMQFEKDATGWVCDPNGRENASNKLVSHFSKTIPGSLLGPKVATVLLLQPAENDQFGSELMLARYSMPPNLFED